MRYGDKTGGGHRSRLFLLTKEISDFPYTERKHRLICRCYEDYWGQNEPATGPRPSFDELFPIPQLMGEVRDSFLAPPMIRQLTELMGRLETAVKRLYDLSCQTDTMTEGTMEDAISDALMAYYALFRSVLKEADSILGDLNLQKDPHSQEGRGYVFLRTLLNLGCSFRDVDSHVVGIVTPFAPRYLSAILETGELLAELDYQGADERLWAEVEILNTFVSRFLRWFLVSPDGTLCHAAVRPVTSFPQEWEDICVLIRPVTDYSSFEGISELRLFEKVKYELEWRAEERRIEEPLRILIAGDIDADQIVKFGRMLESWLKSWRESRSMDYWEPQITFSLFTDNCSFTSQTADSWEEYVQPLRWLRMAYYPMTNLFESPNSLERQVEKVDLLFFLDCRQLYEDFYVVNCSNLSAFFQQTVDLNLTVVHQSASGHVLSPNNPFFQIQNLLLGKLYGKGEAALLKKRVSTTWLNRIEPLLKPKNKMAYFYYSDLDAAQDLYWREDCFVRVEDYAGKCMAILRYGQREGTTLDMAKGKKDKMIVFNLWQFIKHCNLHRVDHLINYFGLNSRLESDSVESIYLLSEILIGVNYADWPKTLRLTYSYPLDKAPFQGEYFAGQLRTYMEMIIHPCFQRESTSIYYAYLRKCIASFLFSDARSVDDVLFVHIFKRHFTLLREVSLEREEDYGKLDLLRPRKTSYSGKRFYQEVMSDYDEPYWYVADQQWKLSLMETSGQLLPCQVFQDIKTACEKNQYAGSDLYRNCTRWLKENHCISG